MRAAACFVPLVPLSCTGLRPPHLVCHRSRLLTPHPLPRLPHNTLQLNAKGFHDGEKQVYTTTNAITTSSVLALRATKSPSGGIYSGRVHSKRFWMPRTENGQYNIIRFETRFRVTAGVKQAAAADFVVHSLCLCTWPTAGRHRVGASPGVACPPALALMHYGLASLPQLRCTASMFCRQRPARPHLPVARRRRRLRLCGLRCLWLLASLWRGRPAGCVQQHG